MVVILSIISIPVGNSLVAAARNSEGNENTLAIDNQLVSQMENLRATYQTQLANLGTPQNSTVTIGNTSYTVITDIEKEDPLTYPGYNVSDPGNQTNFLRLSVTIAGRTLTTDVSN